MRRTALFLMVVLLLSQVIVLSAQENNDQEDPSTGSNWDEIVTAPYSPGDKNLMISLGVLFPLYFSGIDDNQHSLSLGGTGSLSFNYFLTNNIFVGGEISGMFSGTKRGNMLYIVPFGARVGYQFWYSRFEFPITLMLGVAPERYLEKGYFGPALKGGVSAFWRYNPDFSFGLNAIWWFIPQWPKNGFDAYGNFAELTASVRYHF